MFYVCKDTTLLRYHQIFPQKSYQKVVVLTFVYINKVVFYSFSQYVNNILVLFRYYFILHAIIIYIYYTLLYIEKINGVPPGWLMVRASGRGVLPSWAVCLRSWIRSHIPADPDRRSQPETPSVAAQSSSRISVRGIEILNVTL